VLAAIVVEGQSSGSSRISGGAARSASSQTTVAPLMRMRFCASTQSPTPLSLSVLRDRNSGDVETAVGVAPQMQRRLVDAQQAQAQLQTRQRRPREDALDAGKGQRRLPLSIGNAHIGEDQIGVDPLPTGFDLPDDDRSGPAFG
jgi:hypothetical protein